MTSRVPVRTQVSQTECGLACCLALLEYHGRFQTVQQARAIVQPGRNGLSALELRTLLEANGCQVTIFRAGIDRLGELPAPAIIFWREYHFVVLERLGSRSVDLMDPDMGRRTISREEFEDSYSQIILTALPGDDFTPVVKPFLHEWRLPRLEWNFAKGALVMMTVITLITYLLALAMPLATSRIVDHAVAGEGSGGVLGGDGRLLVLIVAVAAGSYICLELLRSLATSRVVRSLGAGLMRSTFHHVLRLPLSYFSTRVPGELMQRLGGLTYLRDVLSNRIVQSIFDFGMTIIVLGYIWHVAPLLGLVASALLLLLLTFLLATRGPLARAIDGEIMALTLAQGVQYDAVSSLAQLKMGGYGQDMEDRWSEEYHKSLIAMHRRMVWQIGVVGAVSAAFQLFGPLTLLLVGAGLGSQVSIGQVVAASTLASTMFAGASGLLLAYTDILTCSRHLGRLEDVLGTAPEPVGGDRRVVPDGRLELRDVTFRYANEVSPVLDRVNLSVADGDMVAVVGRSGSGKSTLAKVLCGLYEPTGGQIRIGGVSIEEYERNALRRRIGYVPQDVTLHNGTILENLRMGSDLTDEQIEQRCRELDFLDFIDDLPMGYRTLVSDLGANFSGGQRQRLAIARVLLRDPQIVVFDEATSALDRINEERVNTVLRNLGATRVVIAHRLETVRDADAIYVTSQGRVVEHGTHHQLLNRAGEYAALYAEGVPA